MTMKALIIGLSCLFTALSAYAQAPSETEPTENAYTFSVVYLNYQPRADRQKEVPGINLKFLSGEEVFHISAVERGMSRDFNYRGAQELVFVKEAKGPEGEPIYQALVSAALGAPGRKLVVVLRNPEGGLLARSFDVDADNFPENTVRLINYSQHTVKAQVGDPIAVVEPMQVKDYKVEGGKRKFLVALTMAATDGERSYIIEKRRFAAAQNGRKILLLYHNPRRLSQVTYTSFTLAGLPEFENTSDKPL